MSVDAKLNKCIFSVTYVCSKDNSGNKNWHTKSAEVSDEGTMLKCGKKLKFRRVKSMLSGKASCGSLWDQHQELKDI